MLPSVKIHLHKRQQREEVPKKMSCSKFVNLAKMGSNLLTKSSPMRPLSTSAVSRFCNGIPPGQDSVKTNTKIEDKEKDSAITYTKKKVKIYTDKELNEKTGWDNWKRSTDYFRFRTMGSE